MKYLDTLNIDVVHFLRELFRRFLSVMRSTILNATVAMCDITGRRVPRTLSAANVGMRQLKSNFEGSSRRRPETKD